MVVKTHNPEAEVRNLIHLAYSVSESAYKLLDEYAEKVGPPKSLLTYKAMSLALFYSAAAVHDQLKEAELDRDDFRNFVVQFYVIAEKAAAYIETKHKGFPGMTSIGRALSMVAEQILVTTESWYQADGEVEVATTFADLERVEA